MTGSKRYVLFYPNGIPPLEEVDLIKRHPGVTVVDGAIARAFLLDASCEVINDLQRRLPSWVFEKERRHPAS